MRGGALSGEEFSRISQAIEKLSHANIYIDDTSGLGVLEARAKARRLKAEHGLDLLILDYIQLMQGRGRFENRQQELASISRALKGLAKELKTVYQTPSHIHELPKHNEGYALSLSANQSRCFLASLVTRVYWTASCSHSLIQQTHHMICQGNCFTKMGGIQS